MPSFSIEKGNDGKYSSVLNPQLLLDAAQSGMAGNAFLGKDGKTFIGTINQESGDVLHIYFPDYVSSKVYDLKYNGDKNPFTYTFTELNLDEKPMIVNFTVTDLTTFNCTADKTYEEVDSAYKKGIPIYGRVALGN